MASIDSSYNDYPLVIYRNEEIARHDTMQTLRLPRPQSFNYCVPEEDITPYIMPLPQHIELRKARCAIHISQDALERLFNIDLRSSNTLRNRDVITTYLRVASRETITRLKEVQPIEEGHPVILNKVRFIPQDYGMLYLIELEFWSITIQEAELGRSVFERILHELARNSTQDFNTPTDILNATVTGDQIDANSISAAILGNDLYGNSFDTKRYNVDAEENAHELLKSIITEQQFELYKKENFVEIIGTYGRTYRIRKNSMIQVTQKRLGCKKKSYDLCLEPRDRGTICPTDEVIAKIKLIKADEKLLHKIGNRFNRDGTFNNSPNYLSINFTTIDNGTWQRHDTEIVNNIFNIRSPGIEKANNIQIYLNGVLLSQDKDYIINDSTIEFNQE